VFRLSKQVGDTATILVLAPAANGIFSMNKKNSKPHAVAYVRMPADQPANLSIGAQIKVIRRFAKRRGLKIERVYSDGENKPNPSMPVISRKTIGL
jgi:hypothetical protein